MLLRYGKRRGDAVLQELDTRHVKTAVRFSLIIMAGLGVFISVGLMVELLVRFFVPQYGTYTGGVQWYAVRDWLPWSLVLPAAVLWQFGAAGPPTQTRWLCWPVVILLAPPVAWLALRLTRPM
jgi:hypothetical protein